MPEIFSNTLFRLLLVLIPTLFLLIFKDKQKVDWFIYAYILGSLLGEVVTILVPSYNIIWYARISIYHLVLLTTLIFFLKGKKWYYLIGVLPYLVLFFYFHTTDYSSLWLFNIPNQYEITRPLTVHQYFDLLSIQHLCTVLLMFIWLYDVINKENVSFSYLKKRLVYIFSFLIFYGGTFFAVAFARLALPSYDKYWEMWSNIYHPTYFVMMLGLLIGLSWNQQHLS